MYITVKTIKRNFGFRGVELYDLIIGVPIILLFIALFIFTNLQTLSIIGLMISVFCLLPVNISQKNRMYKVIFLIIKYCFKNKMYIYKKESMVNDPNEKRC